MHNAPLEYVHDITFALKDKIATRNLLIMRPGRTLARGSPVDLEKKTAPHHFNVLVVVAVY